MQCINEAFGGATVRAPLPVHGKTDAVYHEGENIFTGIPSPFTAARYHSLAVEQKNGPLAVSAKTGDGVSNLKQKLAETLDTLLSIE
jgi:anthranilate synthase component 2